MSPTHGKNNPGTKYIEMTYVSSGKMITFIIRKKNFYYHNLTETLQRTEKEGMANS